jgi:hypothetical protein
MLARVSCSPLLAMRVGNGARLAFHTDPLLTGGGCMPFAITIGLAILAGHASSGWRRWR